MIVMPTEIDTTPDTNPFIKYPKIKILGDEENAGILDGHIIIEEKFDGANMRILLTINGRTFGSRNRELELQGEKQFTRCINYVNDKLDTHKAEIEYIIEKYGSVILFGEAALRHTIGYDFEHIPPFLGFDVYVIATHTFLDREDKVRIFENLGLEPIKLIYEGPYTDESLLEIPKSAYYDGKSEGIVIKSFDTQLFAKKVDECFKEKNKEAFGGSKKFAKNDNEYFISVYCTNARIEKNIFKRIDEGDKLNMTIMGTLFKEVYKDIWEEEYRELYQSNLSLNFKKLKTMVALRCKSVLEQMIQNNAISKT